MGEQENHTVPTMQMPEAAPQPETLQTPAAPTLRQEMQTAEDGLTDQERTTLKTTQQEMIGKLLVIGCIWGMILGALISKFLLGGTVMSGIYTGIVLGMLLGLGAGLILGALEKAMLLQRIGKYAKKDAPAEQKTPTPPQG
ncbi:MAG: hypothetical protein LKJ90_07340 [Faecalibacterium sp.]|jgi:F0F1-type ATP synthase assembly protein I|nr:hypothetical protein [Faecalibacterium sp.]